MNQNFMPTDSSNLTTTDPELNLPISSEPSNLKSKSFSTKKHTKVLVGFVVLVLLAVISVGAMLFASTKSQDQRSNAAGIRCPGFCAKTCSSPYSPAPRGMYACSNTSYVCCVQNLMPSPTVVASTPTPAVENDNEPNDYSRYGLSKAYGPLSRGLHLFSLGAGCNTSWGCADGNDLFYFISSSNDYLIIRAFRNENDKFLGLMLKDDQDRELARSVYGVRGQAEVRYKTTPGKKYYIMVDVQGDTAVNGKGVQFNYKLEFRDYQQAPPTPTLTPNLTQIPAPCPVCQAPMGQTNQCVAVSYDQRCLSPMTCVRGYCVNQTPTLTPVPTSPASPIPTAPYTPTPRPPTPTAFNNSSCYGKPNGYPCGQPGMICMNNACIYYQPQPTATTAPSPTPYR